jgi:hypothetical protein
MCKCLNKVQVIDVQRYNHKKRFLTKNGNIEKEGMSSWHIYKKNCIFFWLSLLLHNIYIYI